MSEFLTCQTKITVTKVSETDGTIVVVEMKGICQTAIEADRLARQVDKAASKLLKENHDS